MRAGVIAVVAIGMTATMSLAERPPQKREEADTVIVGKISKIETKERSFARDGIITDYTATVEVTEVKKGKNLEKGKTIQARWFKVTTQPSDPPPGAYGHGYNVKKGDTAAFWLIRNETNGYEVIYNSDGIEKSK